MPPPPLPPPLQAAIRTVATIPAMVRERLEVPAMPEKKLVSTMGALR